MMRTDTKMLLSIIISLVCIESIAVNTYEKDSISNGLVLSKNDTIVKKKGLLDKFLDYFNDANKNTRHKKFDFSILGGPHYSTDTKLGLGLVAAGLYKTAPNDSLLPPSNVSLFGDVSTVGFYLLGVRGNHLFPKNRYRLNYNLYFYSFPSYIWGIGYEMGDNNANKTKMKRWQARIKTDFLIKVIDNLYIGPMVSLDFVRGKDLKHPDLLNNMDLKTSNYGVGWSVVYDTRDVITNPHKGAYLELSQCFRPHFLENEYDFTTTDLKVRGYTRLWKDCICAVELNGIFNSGNPPWALMALLGNSNSMRGYYEGRYRDKNKIEGQVEFRQHLWKRNGVVLWLGAGNVFHKVDMIKFDNILPNLGIGYRWEFKKNVNVRLDYGFGKNGQSGFLFNINEAF